MAIYNISAGHNPDGKVACGAVGLIKESTVARQITAKVIEILKSDGHTVYDCTCNDGISQANVLTKIVNKCNAHKVDLDISIHLNAGANDPKGNGYTTGTEVLVYSPTSGAQTQALAVCENMAKLGFKNRGVKTRPDLYYLKKTNAAAMLIEVCFVDDADDVSIININNIALAIASGIVGKQLSYKPSTSTTPSTTTSINCPFKIKVIDKTGLNIRKGPGTNYAIVGCITDSSSLVKKNPKFYYPNVPYTITEVKGSWGKLKSGLGWVNISTKYVKYV